MQDKFTCAVQQTINRRKLLEIIFHPFNNSHSLTVLILHHGILLQRLCPDINLRQRAHFLKGCPLRFKYFSFTNRNFQFRIKSCKEPRHHVLKTIKHGECTDPRQRSQRHSAHRNAGNDIDSVVLLLREEIAPGYVEGKVHFNNSSIFSR